MLRLKCAWLMAIFVVLNLGAPGALALTELEKERIDDQVYMRAAVADFLLRKAKFEAILYKTGAPVFSSLGQAAENIVIVELSTRKMTAFRKRENEAMVRGLIYLNRVMMRDSDNKSFYRRGSNEGQLAYQQLCLFYGGNDALWRPVLLDLEIDLKDMSKCKDRYERAKRGWDVLYDWLPRAPKGEIAPPRYDPAPASLDDAKDFFVKSGALSFHVEYPGLFALYSSETKFVAKSCDKPLIYYDRFDDEIVACYQFSDFFESKVFPTLPDHRLFVYRKLKDDE